MSLSAILQIRSKDCGSDANCEKPTSPLLTVGVPMIITGILLLIAISVCSFLSYRNKKKDAKEAELARYWN